jgi:hypothetical protein
MHVGNYNKSQFCFHTLGLPMVALAWKDLQHIFELELKECLTPWKKVGGKQWNRMVFVSINMIYNCLFTNDPIVACKHGYEWT